MTRGKFQVNIDQTKCSSFSLIVTDLPTPNVNLEYLKKRNMCVKLNQKGRLFLAWYSLSYWWPLLYCPVALLAVMRRFYFPNQVDSTASSQMRMLCMAFPTDLSEAMWEWGWNWTQVLPSPPPPPKNKTKQNKTKQKRKKKKTLHWNNSSLYKKKVFQIRDFYWNRLV